MLGRLIGVSLLAGIVFPAGALAGGSIGIRLVDGPPDSGGNPLARVYVVDRVAPGSSISRRVEISNSTSSTATVMVYAAAASLRRGKFAFAPGHTRNELSTWTSVSRRQLRVPADGKAFETVTIKVPKDASAGERYAVIWAEVSTPSPVAGGVRLVNRVGVRMYLSIGPGGSARSNFTIRSLSAERSAVRAAARHRESAQQRPAYARHQRHADTLRWPGWSSRRAVSRQAPNRSCAGQLRPADREARQASPPWALAGQDAAQERTGSASRRRDRHLPPRCKRGETAAIEE